jgi:hypothetical protein
LRRPPYLFNVNRSKTTMKGCTAGLSLDLLQACSACLTAFPGKKKTRAHQG